MKRKKVYSDLLYKKKWFSYETILALELDNIHIIGTFTALELVEIVIQN